MQKVTIRVSVLGQLPPDFDLKALLRWKSSVFSVSNSAETYHLDDDAEGIDWDYTDDQLERYLKLPFSEDFQLILVNVPLKYNWYVRRLTGNRAVFTFHEIADILRQNHIPLKNVVLRVLYALTLVYRRYENRVPAGTESTDYTHDETRGCLFDMNASKRDIIYSCHQPRLCDACVTVHKNAQISNEQIGAVQKEIRHIKKPLFNRLTEFVRQHPILSFLISMLIALVVGTTGSLFGTILYRMIFDIIPHIIP